MSAPRDAVAFLTRIPVADDRPLTAADLSRAASWFPAVGVVVGAVMGGTYLLADLVLPAGPSTVLALLAAILVTGGFHEDGLADAADAAGAHVTRERRLEILRDSRVGTYGALALALPLLLAYSALVTLDGEQVLRAAVAAHVLGRWTTLPMSRLRQARPDGSGTLVRASALGLAVGTLATAAIVLAVAGALPGLAALAVAAVLCAVGALVALRMFGGVSGDLFGATNKVVEVATYAVLVAAW